MSLAYTGNVLRVNLTEGRVWVENPGDRWYRKYFGGTAAIAHYLLKECPSRCDPFDPENPLIFATGPLTGLPLPGTGRCSVGAKSPLTGAMGDSQGGGFWMVELKRAGFDHIVVQGQAAEPVYLWVSNGRAEIRDAGHLWGKDTAEVEEAIREELGDQRVRIAQCGVAGENLVRYACVVYDLTHFAGRTGMGAVMGSKKLRAVAVRGTGQVAVHDRGVLIDRARRLARDVASGGRGAGMKDTGTPGVVASLQAAGGLPTRNFQAGAFSGAHKINGQTLRDTILVGRDNCHACPIFCKRVVRTDGRFACDPVYGGPEYETLAALGSNCGIDDLAAIAKGSELCNKWGLDTISTGMTISFVMECCERGVLSPSDLDGMPPRFGDGEAMVRLIERIAHRQGVGDVLAEGTARAARFFGPQTEPFALHTKGQEIPMHEPRLKHGLGVGYAVSHTGADHCHNMHDTAYQASVSSLNMWGVLDPLPPQDLSDAKMRMFYYAVNWRHFHNCAVTCNFVPWTAGEYVDIVRAATGWETSLWELTKIGERAATLARRYNLREGFTHLDDRLPERFHRSLQGGPLEGEKVDPREFDRARLTYYAMMGWDNLGRPTPAKLAELDIFLDGPGQIGKEEVP